MLVPFALQYSCTLTGKDLINLECQQAIIFVKNWVTEDAQYWIIVAAAGVNAQHHGALFMTLSVVGRTVSERKMSGHEGWICHFPPGL